MRTGLPVVLAMVTALGAGSARGEDAAGGAPARRTLSVTGQGEARGTPDRVTISFAVENSATRASEAGAANARTSAAVAAAVKKLLQPADTVTTTRYTIEPRYDTPRAGEAREPHIVGYVARNEVQVESAAVDKVDDLIDAATAAGANRIGGLQFTVADRGALVRQAIERAGADARAQGESAAKGLGVRLKGVVSATTQAPPVTIPRRFEGIAASDVRAASTPIEAGEATVAATLLVTYEIE